MQILIIIVIIIIILLLLINSLISAVTLWTAAKEDPPWVTWRTSQRTAPSLMTQPPHPTDSPCPLAGTKPFWCH